MQFIINWLLSYAIKISKFKSNNFYIIKSLSVANLWLNHDIICILILKPKIFIVIRLLGDIYLCQLLDSSIFKMPLPGRTSIGYGHCMWGAEELFLEWGNSSDSHFLSYDI